VGDVLSVATGYPASWRGLADLPLFACEPWMRAMDGRLEGQPVWLSTGDTPSGPAVGLAGYVVSDPGAYRYGNAAAIAADPASPFASPATGQALAQAGVDPACLFPHLLVSYPGYSSFPVGHARTDRHALRDALLRIAGWAAGEGIAAIALPYAPAGGDLAAAAAQAGYRGWPLTTDSVLDVPPDGFEGYLAALPRPRRHRVRADRRAVARGGLRGVCGGNDLPAGLVERMGVLRAQHRARYGLPADPAAERDRLRRVTGLLRDRVTVFTVEDPAAGGTVVCFTLFVRDRDVWHALYVAADYTDPRHRGTYFESSFYLPVGVAAANGIRHISYGLGSETTKRWRGCRDEPISFLITGLSSEAARVVATLDRIWRMQAP
jgi:hypothetical protein